LEKKIIPGAKSSASVEPVRAEAPPAQRLVRKKHQATAETTREQIATAESVNPTTSAQLRSRVIAPDKSNQSLLIKKSERQKSEIQKSERRSSAPALDRPARVGPTSSADKPVANLMPAAPGARRSDEAPRPLQTYYRSDEGRNATPAPPLARLQTVEKSHPTVKIGTIDVHITPPPLAKPQPNMVRSSSRQPTTALSRGFTSAFGLRQG